MAQFELSDEYRAYINGPVWKAKTRLYWQVRGKFCQACGATNNLHVHHMDYTNFGREPLADLMGVCHVCHRAIHAQHRAGGRNASLRLVTMRFVQAKRLEKSKSRPRRR